MKTCKNTEKTQKHRNTKKKQKNIQKTRKKRHKKYILALLPSSPTPFVNSSLWFNLPFSPRILVQKQPFWSKKTQKNTGRKNQKTSEQIRKTNKKNKKRKNRGNHKKNKKIRNHKK